MNRLSILLCLLALISLSLARIRIANASPDAPPVDVLVNEKLLWSDVRFKEVTAYATLPYGTYNVTVVPSGKTSPVLLNTQLEIHEASPPVTAAASGLLASLKTELFYDDNRVPANGRTAVRFISLVSDLGPFDVFDSQTQERLWAVFYGRDNRYLELRPGTYGFTAKVSDKVIFVVKNLFLESGKAYTIWAEGLLSGTGVQAISEVVTRDV
eukprot:TRINITY_DN620_c0_g1_i1.p1 TRINITY_DN620_c0_g1~~TRINITY_DN620_c0_g1_i1.p1  ORF type:complete len:212 (+),score=24.00 TRINITY_DN620_c0_g1_i1:95-730(+)